MSSFTFHCMHYLCFCFQKLMIFVNSDLLFIANILYMNKIQRYGYMFIFEILHIEWMLSSRIQTTIQRTKHIHRLISWAFFQAKLSVEEMQSLFETTLQGLWGLPLSVEMFHPCADPMPATVGEEIHGKSVEIITIVVIIIISISSPVQQNVKNPFQFSGQRIQRLQKTPLDWHSCKDCFGFFTNSNAWFCGW